MPWQEASAPMAQSKTGKTGYAPACRNEWVRDACGKPKVKCGECPNQAFIPISDDVVCSHLAGKASGNSADFTIGIYPMLSDETCWFLAADFDKKSWMADVAAFRDAARASPRIISCIMLIQFCGMFCIIARHCSGILSIIWPIGMPAGG